MSDTGDLFGNPVGGGQLSLFGAGESRMAAPERPPVDHPARARAKLNALLAQVRAAETLPWNARDTRMWRTVFPQMANWLPEDEAEQLRLAFHQEIERLLAA